MNVLLVYPELPDVFFGFKHAVKLIGKKSLFPPLGLMTVAAMLPKGWNKRLVDLNVRQFSKDDLQWANLVFVSGIIVQFDTAHSAIRQCKEAGLRVVAGGTLFTTQYKQFDEVDHFVLNEAEITLPNFIEDLKHGSTKHLYKTSEFCDIRQTPAPMWELADLNQYARMGIQFSRGCPFNCEFCDVTELFGHKARVKSVDQIMCELDSLYSLGWRSRVIFVDDNFIGNKSYVKSHLLPALIEWRKDKKGMPFSTQATVNLADDDFLMEMMVEAGFSAVFVGIETPDEQSLSECNKRQNRNRDLLQSVIRLQKAGLQVIGGFIVGFDSDTESIFQRQVDFIQKAGIVPAMVGLLNALPCTRLCDRMEREGRLIDVGSGDNVDGTTNIIPKMGWETLRNGYQRLMYQLYLPKPYYDRIRKFLIDYRPPKIEEPNDIHSFLTFIRVSIIIGIWGRERFHYWKLLVWTLIHRPRLLSTAITSAVEGYHLRKICEMRIFRDS